MTKSKQGRPYNWEKIRLIFKKTFQAKLRERYQLHIKPNPKKKKPPRHSFLSIKKETGNGVQDCFAFFILSGTVGTRLSQSEHSMRFLEDPWIFSYSQSQVEQQIQDPRFSHGETNSTQLLSQRNTIFFIGRPEPSSRSCSQSYFRFA